ncbi:class I SAM-dependent methyltransferase [Rhodanobacter ginsengiterrae]|uniref:class I SAM-dependent methyltransferase n=1 Tax=Rhodanobacter ginsengiterrae TaxID=2008451 RepID=UPI003CF3151C
MNVDIFAISALAAITAFVVVVISARSYWRRALRWAESVRGMRTRMWDIVALMRLLPDGYIPPGISEWTASPDLLSEIARQIRKRKPSRLLELGSGISTIVTASALKWNNHGHLYSLDHDASYAHATSVELEQAGLCAFAEIRHAPLVKDPLRSSAWYDESVIADIGQLDIVIVDGPPTDLDPNAREPALVTLWRLLSVGGIMIFDDTNRPGDRRMIQAWSALCPAAKLTWLPLEKGCVLIEKLA